MGDATRGGRSATDAGHAAGVSPYLSLRLWPRWRWNVRMTWDSLRPLMRAREAGAPGALESRSRCAVAGGICIPWVASGTKLVLPADRVVLVSFFIGYRCVPRETTRWESPCAGVGLRGSRCVSRERSPR